MKQHASFYSQHNIKPPHERDKEKLRWLQQFLRNRRLQEIDRELIDHIAHAKDTSPSTANRHLALIRAILRKACHDWE
ncbi:hypothetical protein SAMN05216333_1431 [Nitrosomonas oligotropha]|uniref:Core-binding (CB) domain-containing protein n=1 Tax=Nitrosomonas oligotropha TaxID=42354 RepID=A0A1H8UZX4_9PROT|nr:hypothetical protein SAMN05216300_1252 [Nitrosomonas oligotropha]SEP08533.1 hypothetical protein SAMN05216333_1431 [Nitrosomonas oligotropha]